MTGISRLAFGLLVIFQLTGVLYAKDYLINSQDVLEVKVYEEEDLSLTVRVNSDGKIAYPLLGEIEVAGLTVSELEKKLTGLFEKDYLVNPHVNVFVKEFSSIYIYGEIKKPGAYSLKGRLTLVEAISLAGGFTLIASPRRVKILRFINGEEKIIRVNVNRIIKKNRKNEDVKLMPRDIIIVPVSFF